MKRSASPFVIGAFGLGLGVGPGPGCSSESAATPDAGRSIEITIRGPDAPEDLPCDAADPDPDPPCPPCVDCETPPSTCVEGEFAELPAAQALVAPAYVRAGARGGDGSVERPYGSIEEALDAGHRYLWLARGVYDGNLSLLRVDAIHGPCAAETILRGIMTGSGTRAEDEVPLLKGLTLEGGVDHRDLGAAMHWNDVTVVGPIRIRNGALVGTRLSIRASEQGALHLGGAARLELHESRVEITSESPAIVASGAHNALTLVDSIVARSSPATDDVAFGEESAPCMALEGAALTATEATLACHVRIERGVAIIRDSQITGRFVMVDSAVQVSHTHVDALAAEPTLVAVGGALSLTDVVVAGRADPSVDGSAPLGVVHLREGAIGVLDRVELRDGSGIALFVDDGADVSAHDLRIADLRSPYGTALVARRAALDLTAVEVARAESGILATEGAVVRAAQARLSELAAERVAAGCDAGAIAGIASRIGGEVVLEAFAVEVGHGCGVGVDEDSTFRGTVGSILVERGPTVCGASTALTLDEVHLMENGCQRAATLPPVPELPAVPTLP